MTARFTRSLAAVADALDVGNDPSRTVIHPHAQQVKPRRRDDGLAVGRLLGVEPLPARHGDHAGGNTVRVAGTTAGGAPNLDYVDVAASGPAPIEIQAETCTISQGMVESNHLGFTGTGFVNGDNVVGSYVECTLSVASPGSFSLTIRYSNGTTTARPMDITVNGALVGTPSFGSTVTWDDWANASLAVDLNAGANAIRLTATTVNGGPNLDRITLS